jgi:hypothetical protein
MNPTAAANLITETFNNPFAEIALEKLVLNLLNEVDREKGFGYRSGNIIPQAFRDQISSYRRPFVYYDPQGERLDLLIVRLSRRASLDRARAMQRNFATWYLKQTHDDPVEAALIAFYHEDAPDWRFSFVRLEYAFGDSGVEEKLTPVRRYSFLVGPTEPTHTAVAQLLPFLLQDGANPTLAALAAAFQIEKVSKQFFAEYTELFYRLTEALTAALDADPLLRADFARAAIYLPNFAKKLLGQIVFLYFVQKKGWLGVPPDATWGDGRKDFLRSLFMGENGVVYDNYFNDVLEPLFYDALATQRSGDRFTIGGWTGKIPFLNGGLFEPMGGYDWRNTRLLLPNTLFSNRRSAADESGNGILDVFDRYNFTVWEEEPLEKEVAVDPEMLGKLFENLLEVEDRKSKGAFYTPREIVHYMCQESLINYLHSQTAEVATGATAWREEIGVLVRQGTLALQQDAAKEAGLKSGDYVLPATVRAHARRLDDALANIKLCDPAIGSGAFPVGMLHEIIQARLALGAYLQKGDADAGFKRTSYNLKRHAIQESIYGVDIDDGAVEIAKLRLWLSLVVDEESYADIQPLPNLDYKIVQGNSLLGVEKNLFNLDLFNRLDGLKRRYFTETHPQEKTKLKAQIDQLIELLTGDKKTFDFHVYFHEVFADRNGFDVVIGNPPYLGEKKHSQLFQSVIQAPLGKKFYQGKMDFFYFFFHLAIEVANEYATISFITTNYYITATGAFNLRTDIRSRATILQLINFNEYKIFESAAGQHNLITILQKGHNPRHIAQVCRTQRSGFYSQDASNYTLDILRKKDSQTEYYETDNRNVYYGKANYIGFWPKEFTPIFEKMLNSSKQLGEVCHTQIGIKTALDKVYIVDQEFLQGLNRTELDIMKPWYKNSDIKRYAVKTATNRYCIYLTLDTPFDKERIPKLHKYIHDNEEAVKGRKDANLRGAFKKGRWWVLSTPRLEVDFESEKIVVPFRSRKNTFAYSGGPWYASGDVYFITEPKGDCNLKFLLGVLNSKLLFFWLYYRGKRKGELLELYQRPLSEIPIPILDQSKQFLAVKIAASVNTILNTFHHSSKSSIKSEQQKIDQLVYQLYSLTPEEIALVEKSILIS